MGIEGDGQHFSFSFFLMKLKNVLVEKLQVTAKCLIGDFQMQGHLGAGYEDPGNPQTHLPANWGGCLIQLSRSPRISRQNDLWRETH